MHAAARARLFSHAPSTEPSILTPVSRQHWQVTNTVLNSLRMLEVDTTHFSGLSMRHGGIRAALVA